jgi:putative flippase GtrA
MSIKWIKIKQHIDILFFLKTSSTKVQYVRSFVAGGLATVLDMTILFLLTEYAGLHYLLSAAAGFLFGVVILYIINVTWIFERKNKISRQQEFLLFGAISIVGLLCNEGIIFFVVDVLGLWYMIAKLISTVVVFSFNFILRKKILFS